MRQPWANGHVPHANGRIRENTGLQRCRFSEVLLFMYACICVCVTSTYSTTYTRHPSLYQILPGSRTQDTGHRAQGTGRGPVGVACPISVLSANSNTEGSYNVHPYLGDFGHLMIGMFNNYHLCHDLRRFDCVINRSGDTFREMACFMWLM